MKKKMFLMTTLAAAIAAATIPAQAAFAATDASSSDAPLYPNSFVRALDMSENGLTDYAINGDTYAFAVKTTIYVIATDKSGDRALSEFTSSTEVTALDYAEGRLYFKNTSGTYIYPDVSKLVDHEFPATSRSVEIGDDHYWLNSNSELKLLNNKNGNEVLIGEGYSTLKIYNDKAYAVLDDCPYVLEGEKATPLDLGYTDFAAADDIPTGTIRYELKSAEYGIKTATLAGGSYYTQIDPESVAQYFKQIHTLKSDGVISCLVLYGGTKGTDEVSVIVSGGNCYVTATKNLTFSAYTAPVNDWPQGPNGQRKAFIRERTGVYSSPYMSSATLITQAGANQPVAVTVEEKFTLDFIDSVFYRVSYKDEDDKTVRGFVAAGYLDEYDYSADENKPTSSGTEDFTYETNVTTVILVLVVVGLVIIAIAYLTVVGTRPETPTKKKRKKQQDDEE